MAMDEALLDTDILSEVLRNHNAVVRAYATDYLAAHGSFRFSAITRYQVLRGLREKNATTQLAASNTVCSNSQILPITKAIFD